MTTLSHAQVLGFALAAGWTRPDADVITVIANYESGDDPNNVGDQTLSRYGSIGLTQDFTGAHNPAELHLGTGPWTPALVAKLKDPLTNMRAALIIFHEQGFTAWSTYNNLRGTAGWRALAATVAGLAPVLPGPPVSPPPVAVPPGVHQADYLDKLGNVAPGVTQALIRAEAARTCAPGMCLATVRGWWRIPVGAPNAISAWRAVPPAERHAFYTPPAGVPVFWSGGSTGAGHVALSLGGGLVRSGDIDGSGTVATVPIGKVHSKWGETYLGWTETLNGQRVYQRP